MKLLHCCIVFYLLLYAVTRLMLLQIH